MYRKFIELINGLYLKVRSAPFLYGIFFLGLAAAYLPMLSFRLSLKNDALTLSYPLFYFFSEQLRQGIIPWWHPNLHLGFPLHAEPGFPFFSPITWFWALIGSNLYVFTLALWSYILIGAVGMLKLTRWLRFSTLAQVFVSLSFSISGYYAAHLQHPHHLFETAFIPFCLLYTLRLIYFPSFRNSVYLAMSFFFLINSGYPTFILSTVYFLFLLTAFLFLADRSLQRSLKTFLAYACASALLILLLSLPYVVSMTEIYPLFNRKGALSLEYNAHTGGITLKSLISLLFPLSSATEKVFFGTDAAWNNIYVGLLTLIFFFTGLRYGKRKLTIPLLASGTLLLALSFQGKIKVLYYQFIPFYGLLFSNGGFRIYFILVMAVIAGWGIDEFLKQSRNLFFMRAMAVLAALFIIVGLYCLLAGISGGAGVTLTDRVKNLSFRSALLAQSIIGIIFLGLAFLFRKNKKAILAVAALEMIAAFWINLPYTGLGIQRAAIVQNHIDQVIRSERSASTYTAVDAANRQAEPDKFIREPLFYSPAIGIIRLSSYPSGYRSYYDFERSNGPARIGAQKAVFSLAAFSHSSASQISLNDLAIGGNRIRFTANSAQNDTLVILQNNSPDWRFRVNETAAPATKVLGTFIGIPVLKGVNAISGEYKPSKIIVCFMISTFVWVALLILPALRKRKNT